MSAKQLPMVGANPCGGCTECCWVLGVEELNKVHGQECPHRIKGGCDDYANRPQACHNFKCLWLRGLLPGDDYRPDRLGLVFDAHEDSSGTFVLAWEAWQGAADVAAPLLRMVAGGTRLLLNRLKADGGWQLSEVR